MVNHIDVCASLLQHLNKLNFRYQVMKNYILALALGTILTLGIFVISGMSISSATTDTQNSDATDTQNSDCNRHI